MGSELYRLDVTINGRAAFNCWFVNEASARLAIGMFKECEGAHGKLWLERKAQAVKVLCEF